MPPVSTNIKIDPQLKKEAQRLFDDMGLNLSTAINMFLKQAVREQAIPFRVGAQAPNAVTLAALDEGDKILKDPTAPRFSSVEALFEDLDNE